MRIMKALTSADPLARVNIEELGKSALFEDLRQRIVTESSSQHVAPGADCGSLYIERWKQSEQTRRNHRLLLISAVIVVLGGALYGGLSVESSSKPDLTAWQAGRTLANGTNFSSVDGGDSWRLVAQVSIAGWQLSQSSGSLGTLTCPSTKACFTVAGNFNTENSSQPKLLSESLDVSHDFGVTWTAFSLPTGFVSTTQLSCPSNQMCAAAGIVENKAVLIKTTDGGHQWSMTPVNDLGQGVLADLSCNSLTTCRAVFVQTKSNPIASNTPVGPSIGANLSPPKESIATTIDGGVHWSSQRLSLGTNVIGFACPTASKCVLMGTRLKAAQTQSKSRLSKLDTNFENAMTAAFRTSAGMIRLPQFPIPTAFQGRLDALPNVISNYENAVVHLHLPAVVANQVQELVKVSDSLKNDLALNAGGKLPVNQWQSDSSALRQIQQTILEMLSSRAFAQQTSDGGKSWTTATLPVADLGRVDTLSCSSTSVCSAIGSPYTTPVVLLTNNGGSSWHKVSIVPGIPSPLLQSVTCPSSRVCWATGQQDVPAVIGNLHQSSSVLIAGTTNGGNSWVATPLKIPANASDYKRQSFDSIDTISCPTNNACLALGQTAPGAPTTPVYRLVNH